MKNRFFFIFLMLPLCSMAQEEIPLIKTDSFAISQWVSNAERCKNQGDKKEESGFYDKIAYLYWEHNLFTKAVEYYEKSLNLNQHLDNLSGISMINSNLGMIYADQKKYDKSLVYFQKTLDYRRMVKEKVGIISTLINMSVVLNNLKRFDESIRNLLLAAATALEMNDLEQTKSCYGMLSETYLKAGKAKEAQNYFEMYKTLHEKIQKDRDVKSTELVQQAQTQLKLTEAEKKNKELELKLTERELKDKNDRLTVADFTQMRLYQNLSRTELQVELLKKDNTIKNINIQQEISLRQKQQIKLYFVFAFMVLFGLLISILIIAYLHKRKTNKQLAEQKNEISNQRDTINSAYNELKQLNDFKEGMHTMIAHDLKNPLNTILHPPSGYSHDHQIKTIKQAGKQMLNLVLNFLDVQKLENNQFHLVQSLNSLYQAVQEAIDQTAFLAVPKSIKLQNSMSASLAGFFDSEIIIRVLVNLLTNAVKYSYSNSCIEISLSEEADPNFHKILVSNQGEQIPKDKIALVFNKFVQLNPQNSGNVRSTGIGLTFCKMAIEAHQCEIGVNSHESGLTTFWFTLVKMPEIEITQDFQSQPVDMTVELSQINKAELLPVVLLLEKVKIYEITEIRRALKSLEKNQDQSILEWKNKLILAVETSNEVEYQKIISNIMN